MLLVAGPFGTAGNGAIQRYLNQKRVPQLYVVSGASRFNDPEHFPWTMGLGATYRIETNIYAGYLLREKPSAKIAVLYQNDDAGKELLKGIREGLGDKVGQIVAESAYELSEPTIDSHIVKLKASGADVLFSTWCSRSRGLRPICSHPACISTGSCDSGPFRDLRSIAGRSRPLERPRR